MAVGDDRARRKTADRSAGGDDKQADEDGAGSADHQQHNGYQGRGKITAKFHTLLCEEGNEDAPMAKFAYMIRVLGSNSRLAREFPLKMLV
jgi:hypothetical protein